MNKKEEKFDEIWFIFDELSKEFSKNNKITYGKFKKIITEHDKREREKLIEEITEEISNPLTIKEIFESELEGKIFVSVIENAE